MERADFLYDCASAWPCSAVHAYLDMFRLSVCTCNANEPPSLQRLGPLCSPVNRSTRSAKPQHTAVLPEGPDIPEAPPPIWNSQLTTCIARNSQMVQIENVAPQKLLPKLDLIRCSDDVV